MKNTTRELLISVAACLAFPAYSQTVVREYTLEIERQPVAAALTEFSRQTGLQVGYFPETLTESIFIGPLSGRYTAESAIAQLLGSSGLLFERLNERTIAVTGPESARSKRRGFSTMERKVDDGATLSFVRLANLSLAEGLEPEEEEGQQARTGANAWRSDGNKRRRDTLEEVIVTAQKREQRAFDVPISIVALGADELQKRKITNLEDLAYGVPGLTIQNLGGYQRKIILRGISNGFPINGASLVGMYLDEAPVTGPSSSQINLRTYDLERVEVLRGPQGTLFGEGSVGGTIRFITNNPVLDQFAMSADVAAQFTEQGEPGQRIDAMINVPLIENELGLRIAGTYDRQGGWIDQPAAGVNDFNDQVLTNVRIKGLWQPAPQFTVSAMAVIHRDDTSSPNGEDADGNFTPVLDLTTAPSVQDDYDLYNLTLTYDFPAIRILSATSYLKTDKDIRNVSATYQLEAPPAPRWEQALTQQWAYEYLNQELRLTSIGSGPWQWTVGGFYRDVQLKYFHQDLTLGIPGYLLGIPDPFFIIQPSGTAADDRQSDKSWAAFGDMSYELSDRITLGTGLRYFEHDIDAFTAFGPDGKGISALRSVSFHALSPRLYAQYKVTEQVNTYATAAKGFRSGRFNGAPTFAEYDPEEVWTYELGTKMSLSGGRVTADVAVFQSDYTDYQISGLATQPDGTVANVTSNGGNARIRGIEWALAWRPTDQWNLSVNGNYLDTEFVEINTIPNPNGTPSSPYVVGDPLDHTPKYAFTVSAQRDFMWNGRAGFSRLDYNQQGRISLRARHIGPWYYDESDILNLLNFNMGLQWNDRLSLGLFAQNLLNERGYTDPWSIESFAARARPRTYGIEFGVSFD